MPIREELSEEAVETLWALWKERRGKKFADEGLTVEEIATSTGFLVQRIYNAIEELSARGDEWNTIMRVRNKRPGAKAKSYRLHTDNVPDWPRASFLLFELDSFDKRHKRQIDAADFCAHLLKNCAYRHQDDLDEIIRGLGTMGYLYRSPQLSTLAEAKKTGYLLLSLGDRFSMEQKFLEKIACLYPTAEYAGEHGRKLQTSHFLESISYYTNPPKLD